MRAAVREEVELAAVLERVLAGRLAEDRRVVPVGLDDLPVDVAGARDERRHELLLVRRRLEDAHRLEAREPRCADAPVGHHDRERHLSRGSDWSVLSVGPGRARPAAPGAPASRRRAPPDSTTSPPNAVPTTTTVSGLPACCANGAISGGSGATLVCGAHRDRELPRRLLRVRLHGVEVDRVRVRPSGSARSPDDRRRQLLRVEAGDGELVRRVAREPADRRSVQDERRDLRRLQRLRLHGLHLVPERDGVRALDGSVTSGCSNDCTAAVDVGRRAADLGVRDSRSRRGSGSSCGSVARPAGGSRAPRTTGSR